MDLPPSPAASACYAALNAVVLASHSTSAAELWQVVTAVTATATVNVMKTATVPEAYRFFAVSSHVAFDTLPAGPAGHLNE